MKTSLRLVAALLLATFAVAASAHGHHHGHGAGNHARSR